jgi:hypothetical protein
MIPDHNIARLARKANLTTLFLPGSLALVFAGEIDTLCYPRAALFVFCVALAASNVLGLIKGALRATHGAEAAQEVSGYYLGDEIAGTQRGMMIAIPAEHWIVLRKNKT